jgi:hypothetical protein
MPAAAGPPARPAGLDRQEAERLVADASERIWHPEGAAALAYLKGRGLTEATIRAARIGWADKIRMPKRDGSGTWPLAGIVLPWLDSGKLTRIKVRRLGLIKGAKYVETFSDAPSVYPSMATIQPDAALVLCEGEFDAALLGQELDGLAAVVTLGSASARPDPSMWLALARCSALYIALDGDPAGDDASKEWGGRAVRVRPPEPCKDWGELHATGFNRIRYLWGGILRRAGKPWQHLAKERWGPGLTDSAPGIVVDRPVRPAIRPGPDDEHDRPEGAAIQQFDGRLSREAAKRAADLRPSRGSD